MDDRELAKLKQLANDAIIESFGRDDLTAKLAVALEKAVSELEWNDKKPHCRTCTCYA